MSSSDEVNIKVAIRIRPTNEREKSRNAKQIVSCDQDKKQVNLTYGTGKKAVSKTFSFDKVFGQYSTQAEVFTSMVAPIVDEVMEGYNCTVFAYGQTGTGKTHTMEGQFDDPEHRGIIPRSVHLIFEQLEDKKVDFSVKVSYLEIYNEELGDLLDDSYGESSSDKRKSMVGVSTKQKKLLLCDGEKGVMCNHLTEINCCSAQEVFESLRKGINARQVAETQMNKASSRSHSIVTLKIMIKEATVNGEQVRFGQLNLVDLAGSECVQRSGATGERLREAGNINQSLLTLGRVITGLSDRKSGFIPYRDSKLTRLLQESLGGRAKTCIVATLSPADDSADESGSTLEYAQRARSIKNKPITNSTSSKNSVLREYTQEVEEMRKVLQAQREKSGTYLPTEKYEEMISALETGKANLSLCEEELGRLREQLSAEKCRADGLASDLAFSRKQCAQVQAELSSTKDLLLKTEDELDVTKSDLYGTQAIVLEQTNTETKLMSQAKTLDVSLNESTNDIQGLLAKVHRATLDADSKSRATSEVGMKMLDATCVLRQKCSQLTDTIKSSGSELKALLAAAIEKESNEFDEVATMAVDFDARIRNSSIAFFDSSISCSESIKTQVQSIDDKVNQCASSVSECSSNIETSITQSIAEVKDLVEQQEKVLEVLAKHVEESAQSTEIMLTDFIQRNSAAVQSAQQIHREETTVQLSLLSQMHATIKGFTQSHLTSIEAMQATSEEQRKLGLSECKEMLQSESEVAALCAMECEKQARIQREAIEKDAEELLHTFTAALNSFKTRQMDACTATATSTSSSMVAVAKEHKESMLGLMSKLTNRVKLQESESCDSMLDEVNSMQTSASSAIATIEAKCQSSSENIHRSIDDSINQCSKFAASTSSLMQNNVGTSKVSIDQATKIGTDAVSEVVAMQESVDRSKATISQVINDVKSSCSYMVATVSDSVDTQQNLNRDQEHELISISKERQQGLIRSLETIRSEALVTSEAIATVQNTVSEQCNVHVSAHEDAIAMVEMSMKEHVAYATQPLTVTGATPEKRKFEHPEQFAETRPHPEIMKEAKKKRSKLSSDKMMSTCLRDSEYLVSENEAPRSVKQINRDSIGGVVKNPLMDASNLK